MPASSLSIAVEDPRTPDVLALLEEHLSDMRATSPPESVHALDPDALAAPGITFFTVREQGLLLGCGALSDLDSGVAEIKSMRTSAPARGRGVASLILGHIIEQAQSRGFVRVSLETGSEDYFTAARALYAKFGFTPCPPFADYTDDPNSAYFSLELI